MRNFTVWVSGSFHVEAKDEEHATELVNQIILEQVKEHNDMEMILDFEATE